MRLNPQGLLNIWCLSSRTPNTRNLPRTNRLKDMLFWRIHGEGWVKRFLPERQDECSLRTNRFCCSCYWFCSFCDWFYCSCDLFCFSCDWFYSFCDWFSCSCDWFYSSSDWFYSSSDLFYSSSDWFYSSSDWFCSSCDWLYSSCAHLEQCVVGRGSDSYVRGSVFDSPGLKSTCSPTEGLYDLDPWSLRRFGTERSPSD